MSAAPVLVIFGASTRAAAFSALRAGLQPWCADLFADADLQARCPVTPVAREQYPEGFQEIAKTAPPGPWMYTGALENHDTLVRAITRKRKLWGNDQAVLGRVRSPVHVAQLLQDAGLPYAEVFYEYPAEEPTEGQWLLKPVASAGGIGIRPWAGGKPASSRPVYLQEHIEGEPCSAVYVASGGKARLLGVTAQLVGERTLHAAPFHYCGSIGPLMPDKRQWDLFMRLGNAIAAGCGLRGLFGIDCILADDVPVPVEVNPRYTASVEVIEHATETAALGLHAQVFDPTFSPSPLGGAPGATGWGEGAHHLAPSPPGGEGWGEGAAFATTSPSPPTPLPQGERGGKIVGKAILFAWMALLFPADGPWMESLRRPGTPWDLPAFADIPQPGETIEAGRPILTFFARADSVAACREKLGQIALELDNWLFAR